MLFISTQLKLRNEAFLVGLDLVNLIVMLVVGQLKPKFPQLEVV